MFFLLLMACFERSNQRIDAIVNLRQGNAAVTVVSEGVSFSDDDAPATVEAAITRLAEERTEALERIAGTDEGSAHYAIVAGRLDFIVRVAAPIAWFEGDHGQPMHAGEILTSQQWAKGSPGKPGVWLLTEQTPTQSLSITGTGHWRLFKIPNEKPGEFAVVVEMARGLSTLHVETHTLSEAGEPVAAPIWVPNLPGLAEAMASAGLLGT
jgi:hypothetical protein